MNRPQESFNVIEDLGSLRHTDADMSTFEFHNDDAGYKAWLATHPDGYVINIARSRNASTARVHRADCRTLNRQSTQGGAWTGPYVKVCAQSIAELENWTEDHVGKPIPTCGTCDPAPHPRSQAPRLIAAPQFGRRPHIQGPSPGNAIVQAWADDYIRFERLPDWQRHLRTEIKARCRQLEPSAKQVLHASYFGAKHSNADIENLMLYNIDSFRVAGRNGIRFEHGAAAPPTPDGVEYPFSYRYALAPRSGDFAHWQQGRTLASFGWTDLGAFAGEKRLAQVWLALARSEVEVHEPCASATPFAVKLQVRPPQGHQPVWGNLLKGIFDGVICAFQAHTDRSVLPEAVARIAATVSAEPAEIEARLLDQRRAVLGVVLRLVCPYRKGVKWDPTDHLCVAGELFASESLDKRWAIRGQLVELSR